MSAAADNRPSDEKPRHVHLVLRNVLLPTGVSYHGVRALSSSAEGGGRGQLESERERRGKAREGGRRTVDVGLAP